MPRRQPRRPARVGGLDRDSGRPDRLCVLAAARHGPDRPRGDGARVMGHRVRSGSDPRRPVIWQFVLVDEQLVIGRPQWRQGRQRVSGDGALGRSPTSVRSVFAGAGAASSDPRFPGGRPMPGCSSDGRPGPVDLGVPGQKVRSRPRHRRPAASSGPLGLRPLRASVACSFCSSVASRGSSMAPMVSFAVPIGVLGDGHLGQIVGSSPVPGAPVAHPPRRRR